MYFEGWTTPQPSSQILCTQARKTLPPFSAAKLPEEINKEICARPRDIFPSLPVTFCSQTEVGVLYSQDLILALHKLLTKLNIKFMHQA